MFTRRLENFRVRKGALGILMALMLLHTPGTVPPLSGVQRHLAKDKKSGILGFECQFIQTVKTVFEMVFNVCNLKN